MHFHNFYLSDDRVTDVDRVAANAGIDGPRTESQRTTGVGETDELGRRWHGRALQGPRPVVARPGPAVASGGRGMAGAPRGEAGTARARRGHSTAGTAQRARRARRGRGGRRGHGRGHGRPGAGAGGGGSALVRGERERKRERKGWPIRKTGLVTITAAPRSTAPSCLPSHLHVCVEPKTSAPAMMAPS